MTQDSSDPKSSENFDPFNFDEKPLTENKKTQPNIKNRVKKVTEQFSIQEVQPNMRKRVRKVTEQFSIQEAQSRPSMKKRVRKLTEQIQQVTTDTNDDDPFAFKEKKPQENTDALNEKSQRLQNLSLVLEQGKGLQETQKITLRKKNSNWGMQLVIGLLLVSVAAYGIYFYWNLKQSQNLLSGNESVRLKNIRQLSIENVSSTTLFTLLSLQEAESPLVRKAAQARANESKLEIQHALFALISPTSKDSSKAKEWLIKLDSQPFLLEQIESSISIEQKKEAITLFVTISKTDASKKLLEIFYDESHPQPLREFALLSLPRISKDTKEQLKDSLQQNYLREVTLRVLTSSQKDVDILIAALKEQENIAQSAKQKLKKIKLNSDLANKLLLSVDPQNSHSIRNVEQVILSDVINTKYISMAMQERNLNLHMAALLVASNSEKREEFVEEMRILAAKNPKKFAAIVSDTFSQIGPSILPVVLSMLQGKASEVYVGLHTLRKMENSARFAIPAVIKLLRHKSKKNRVLAKEIVVNLREKSYLHLVKLYKDTKWRKVVLSVFYQWKEQVIPGLKVLAKQKPIYTSVIKDIIGKVKGR